MRLTALAGFALLAGCSESIQVFVRHDCPTPVSVSIVDDEHSQPLRSIDPGVDTVIYGICCEPGQDGELTVSVGPWAEVMTYDRLRDDPLVVIPAEACPAV